MQRMTRNQVQDARKEKRERRSGEYEDVSQRPFVKCLMAYQSRKVDPV